MAQQTKRLTYFSVYMNVLTGGRAYRGGRDNPAGFLTLTCTGRKLGQRHGCMSSTGEMGRTAS